MMTMAKMKTVTMWTLVWNGRTSLKLYTKVQINRMIKNMAKHGIFAYGSALKVNCWVHTNGKVTWQAPLGAVRPDWRSNRSDIKQAVL